MKINRGHRKRRYSIGCTPLPIGDLQLVRLYLLGEEAEASPSIAKYFVARLNDVRAFGYNSTGSERIWMKFGELRVYGLELSWQILGAIRAEAASGGRAEILFFFVH